MMCVRPAILKSGGSFPCGQCLNCKVNKKRVWIARCLLETSLHKTSYFITLTYSVPKSEVIGNYETYISKYHVQLFFKRLRRRFPDDVFRYFVVGEYGELRGRAHYHVLLWCSTPLLGAKVFEALWRFGSVDVGDVQHESIDYVCGYMLEDGTVKNNVFSSASGRVAHPVFRLMSRGIGSGAVESLTHRNILNREFRVLGKTHPIGRYLRLKFLKAKSITEYWERNGNVPIQKSAEKGIEESLHSALRLVPFGSDAYAELQRQIINSRKEREATLVKRKQIAYYRNINQPLKGRKNETF